MYLQDYMWFMVAIFATMILSLAASSRVKSTFSKHDKESCRSGYTGSEAVSCLLRRNGAGDIMVGATPGFLTDHYHPKRKIVNLSESTCESRSVAAVAVAAHEVGHVMQEKDGYAFYRFRTALVPVVNFGSRLALPLVFVGIFLNLYSATANPDTGFYVALVGVALYGSSLLFALITLPVELNASARAREMLISEGIISESQLPAARAVLSAAAMTYLASLLTSAVYFLRFLLQVLSIFGRRNRR